MKTLSLHYAAGCLINKIIPIKNCDQRHDEPMNRSFFKIEMHEHSVHHLYNTVFKKSAGSLSFFLAERLPLFCFEMPDH